MTVTELAPTHAARDAQVAKISPRSA